MRITMSRNSDIHGGTSEKNEKKITCYNLIQCENFDYIFVAQYDSIQSIKFFNYFSVNNSISHLAHTGD